MGDSGVWQPQQVSLVVVLLMPACSGRAVIAGGFRLMIQRKVNRAMMPTATAKK